MNNITLKAKILRFTEEGLIKHLHISNEEAQNYIQKSSLEKAIDRAPDVVAHYSQEQLVAYVVK